MIVIKYFYEKIPENVVYEPIDWAAFTKLSSFTIVLSWSSMPRPQSGAAISLFSSMILESINTSF